MLAQTLRASRQSLVRAARPANASMLRRTFIAPTAVRQADMVQDMYLKELKAYKAPPVKPGDADAHVQKYKAPQPPASPEEADLTKDLKAYEDQVPEVEGQSSEGGEATIVHDWFEEEPEEEEHGHH